MIGIHRTRATSGRIDPGTRSVRRVIIGMPKTNAGMIQTIAAMPRK